MQLKILQHKIKIKTKPGLFTLHNARPANGSGLLLPSSGQAQAPDTIKSNIFMFH